MSMKNNKAARLNRHIMYGTFLMGIIVLGCVFGVLYMSYRPGEDQTIADEGDTLDALFVDSIPRSY